VVIVAKLDRLFRSVAEAANVIDDFDKRGIQLVAIAESFDMTSRLIFFQVGERFPVRCTGQDS
jgi:DNA invertase Pin-like site-specific DNA recombinase